MKQYKIIKNNIKTIGVNMPPALKGQSFKIQNKTYKNNKNI